MTTRILRPEEWERLKGTEAEDVIPFLATLKAQALVVEDESLIVGCWLLMPMWHAECLWIAPNHRRRGGVGVRLLRGLRATAKSLGIDRLWTGANSDEVRRLLDHYGAVAMPGEHFVMSVKGR